MAEFVPTVAALLLGILVPACAGWLWNKVKTELNAGNATLMHKIEEIQIEQQTMRSDHSALRAVQITQGEAIAYLQGADSQRAQTATAALEAARLLLHPSKEGAQT